MSKTKLKTPAHILERKREYYITHRAARIAYAKAYYQNNKERIAKKRRERREQDPTLIEREREYHRKYYHKRRAKIKNTNIEDK